jgi:hypothetical protein
MTQRVTEGPNTNGFGGWRRQRWRRRTAKPPPKGKSLAMLVQEKGQGRIRRTARSEALGAQRLALLTSSLPAPSRGLLLVGAREMSSRKADGCTTGRDNGQFDQTDHASKHAGSRYLARARSLTSREVPATAGPSRRPNSAASLPACLPVHGRSVPFFSSTAPLGRVSGLLLPFAWNKGLAAAAAAAWLGLFLPSFVLSRLISSPLPSPPPLSLHLHPPPLSSATTTTLASEMSL